MGPAFRNALTTRENIKAVAVGTLVMGGDPATITSTAHGETPTGFYRELSSRWIVTSRSSNVQVARTLGLPRISK